MKLAMTFFCLSLISLNSNFSFAQEAISPLAIITAADGRNVAATQDGRVAYTFDADDVNVSNCYDACAKAWPPIIIDSSISLQAPMGVTTRRDGLLQLTHNQQPLYFFIGDKNPGDINGDGVGGVWHIIAQ